MMRRWITGFLAALMPLVSAPAFAEEPSSSHPVRVEMVSEHSSVRSGEAFWLAVHFEMDAGWHVYWKNPGEAGLAPQLEWDLPEGVELKEVEWPQPHRFEQSSLVSYGYEEEMTLLVKVQVTEALAAESVDMGLNVRWVVCKDSCLPGGADVKVSIPLLAEAPKADPQHAELFASARAAIPRPTDDVVAMHEGDQVVLNLEAFGDVAGAYFFPDPGMDGVFDYSAAQEVVKTASGYSLALPSEELDSSEVALSGVLVLMGDEEAQAFQVETPLAFDALTAIPLPTDEIAEAGGLSFGVILLMAFAGGFLLNLMPCVLPVISLKILGFVNMSGSSRKKIFEHGVLFTLGVLVSFWILAGALLVLRAYGEGVGWGFQLQDPMFVMILVMVLFLLGLSLLGVFEFGTSLSQLGGKVSGKTGWTATFMSGVLATVVATPCTGPFLAPALGVAVTLPAAGSLLVFTVMGLGMSLPYLLLAAFPKLVNKLPKPGPWMVTFKQLMGFVMLATTLWLLWVFQAEVQSAFALIKLLAALLVMGIGAWVYGKWGTPIMKKGKRYIGYTVTVLLAAFSLLVGYQASQEEGTDMVRISASSEAVAGNWVEWDPEKFAQLRADGVPVFVDFTAKWCLICQANKVPMGKAEVMEKFRERGVVLMEADWTRRDPVITAELAKHERNGVPLYILYTDDEQPIVLPQMLTPGILIDALDNVH